MPTRRLWRLLPIANRSPPPLIQTGRRLIRRVAEETNTDYRKKKKRGDEHGTTIDDALLGEGHDVRPGRIAKPSSLVAQAEEPQDCSDSNTFFPTKGSPALYYKAQHSKCLQFTFQTPPAKHHQRLLHLAPGQQYTLNSASAPAFCTTLNSRRGGLTLLVPGLATTFPASRHLPTCPAPFSPDHPCTTFKQGLHS
jgi:hypothetical protein